MSNQKEITLTNGSVIRTLESNCEVSRGNRAKMIDWMDMSYFLSKEEIEKILDRYDVAKGLAESDNN